MSSKVCMKINPVSTFPRNPHEKKVNAEEGVVKCSMLTSDAERPEQM